MPLRCATRLELHSPFLASDAKTPFNSWENVTKASARKSPSMLACNAKSQHVLKIAKCLRFRLPLLFWPSMRAHAMPNRQWWARGSAERIWGDFFILAWQIWGNLPTNFSANFDGEFLSANFAALFFPRCHPPENDSRPKFTPTIVGIPLQCHFRFSSPNVFMPIFCLWERPKAGILDFLVFVEENLRITKNVLTLPNLPPTPGRAPRIAPECFFFARLGSWVHFQELLQECLRIARVALRVAFSLQERLFFQETRRGLEIYGS